jgi:hypothetical protein
MSMAIILRQDLGVAWTLLPNNMYMEVAIDEVEQEGPSAPSAEGIVEYKKLGTEVVNGWPTTRYHVLTRQDGEQVEGYFWITEHWIPIRMELSSPDHPGDSMTMEVRDLRIQAQDPALFEIPAGATKLAVHARSDSGPGSSSPRRRETPARSWRSRRRAGRSARPRPPCRR